MICSINFKPFVCANPWKQVLNCQDFLPQIYLMQADILQETGWRCWCLLLQRAVFWQSRSWQPRWRSRWAGPGWFQRWGCLQASLCTKVWKRKIDQTFLTCSFLLITKAPINHTGQSLLKWLDKKCLQNLRTGMWCSTPHLNDLVPRYCLFWIDYYRTPIFSVISNTKNTKNTKY